MVHGLSRISVLGIALLVVGCGGGGGTAGSPTAATAAPATTSSSEPGGADPASTEPTAAAEASTAAVTDPPAGGGTSGGTAAGVCELVTADELVGIFGVTSVKTTVIPGPPDNCVVESDSGDPLVAWSLTTVQASVIYDAFTTDPSTVPVSGVGDKAAIVQNTGLMVLKGGNLVVITISGGSDMTEEEGIEASKQVAGLAAGRL